MPGIDVSPPLGKLPHLLARMIGARRVLEIGTLGGYSTIWLARALPDDGVVVTIEADRHHAEVARANVERAGRVDLRLDQARDVLPTLGGDGGAPFDLVFIDADKPNHGGYLAHALRLARPGAVIVGDNVVRRSTVVDADSDDPNVQGVRRFFDLLAEEPRLSATAIQTVGSKGWDGFALAVVE